MALIPWMTGGAMADELRYDPDVLTACLDEPAPETCIGRAMAACMEAEGSPFYGSTVALCSAAESAQWRGLLDAAYAELSAEAEELDMMAQQSGMSEPGPPLEAMRRDWDAFMASALAYEQARWLGGSAEGPEMARSNLYLTAVQAIWLMRANGQLD